MGKGFPDAVHHAKMGGRGGDSLVSSFHPKLLQFIKTGVNRTFWGLKIGNYAYRHILLYPSDFTLRGSVLFQVLDLRGGTTRLHVCGNPNGMRHKSISLTCQTFVGQVMQHICQSSTLLQMVLVKSQSIKISVVNNSIFKPSYQFEGEQKATVSNKNAVIWLPYFCANMQRLFWAVDQFSSLEKWENVRFFSQMDEPPIYEPRVHNFSTFCVEIGVLWRYRWTSTHLWEKIPTWSRFPLLFRKEHPGIQNKINFKWSNWSDIPSTQL